MKILIQRFAAFLFFIGTLTVDAKTPAVLNFTKNPLLPGKPIALSQYAGKVVLIVNVASRCGFTGQYKDLEALHKQYRDRGLVVLGIPANDFGGQEPGTNQQIAEFCESNYGVTFQMLEKLTTPIEKDPLYAALIKATGERPMWNFHKYLVDRSGAVQSFSSNVAPMSATMTRAIESALRN